MLHRGIVGCGNLPMDRYSDKQSYNTKPEDTTRTSYQGVMDQLPGRLPRSANALSLPVKSQPLRAFAGSQ